MTAESYFQHPEHYFRILTAMNQAAQPNAPQGGQVNGGNGQHQHRRPLPAEPSAGPDEADEQSAPAGLGEQPGAETRDIPIAAAPPED